MKRKSKSGTTSTTPTSGSGYSVAEICEIIASCRKNGVVTLKLPQIELDFGVSLPSEGAPAPKLTKKQAATAKANEEAALRANEFKTRMDQLEYLRLADPVEYEALVARGELEHAGEKSERTNAS